MKPIVAHRIFYPKQYLQRRIHCHEKSFGTLFSALHGDKKWSKTEKISHKPLFHLTRSTCASY